MSITRILIIADTRDTVDELRDFCESNGYETEVALNNKVASAILEERRMDLVLIGFDVQDKPDFDIVKTFRTENPFIPIILIYENNSKRIKTLLRKSGAQEHVERPFEKDAFLRTIEKVLTSHSKKVGLKATSR